MLETIRFHFRLRKLQKQKREMEKHYSALTNEARAKKDYEADGIIAAEYFSEKELFDDEIYKMVSDRVLNLADRYLIPRPDFDEKSGVWVCSEIDEKWRLSEAAIWNLKRAINEERGHRLMWLTGITGVIGAIIGLLSTLAGLLR